jgi:hypothetical protein
VFSKEIVVFSHLFAATKGSQTRAQKDLSVKKARYDKYAELCALYEWCFATDFRDVFFQADPFNQVNCFCCGRALLV